jgi:transposase
VVDARTYHKIRFLHSEEHLSIAQIAVRLSLSRKTVSKWLRVGNYAPYRASRISRKIASFEGLVKALWGVSIFRQNELLQTLVEHGYQGGRSTLGAYVATLAPTAAVAKDRTRYDQWFRSVMQCRVPARRLSDEIDGRLAPDDVARLASHIRNGPLPDRNRAVAILASLKRIPLRATSRFLMITRKTARSYVARFQCEGLDAAFRRRCTKPRKCEKPEYKDAVFAVLHAPPKDFGINRATWFAKDVRRVLGQQGYPISRDCLRRIIRNAGFRVRTAKRVLTSTDPQYQEKLAAVTKILSDLSESEKFFSIDEFGPFAVKSQGGKALVGPGERRIVQQWQKSKGSLTIIGALELVTNQMTHFYADSKTSNEMIDLLYRLLRQYCSESRLYLSWDAASWHASRKFLKEVEHVNRDDYRSANGTPAVSLAPLPACAQFLNVIESVYSGMAKAVIHNSDYASVAECKQAIDGYFRERNEHFRLNPSRAGNRIWGQEREPPVFKEGNNCKDPAYYWE